MVAKKKKNSYIAPLKGAKDEREKASSDRAKD
jgi:hypothetical protein